MAGSLRKTAISKFLVEKNYAQDIAYVKNNAYLCTHNLKGEVAEWSIAAVLKTVEGHTSGGSNPSLSAWNNPNPL